MPSDYSTTFAVCHTTHNKPPVGYKIGILIGR